jgi:hypothetical protein
MNALDVDVYVQAHGKPFSFKPRQIKNMHNPNLAMFLSQNRGENGLVDIADEVMELDKNSPEFLEAIEAKRKEGIEKRINKLRWIINNLESSLRYDIETKGLKIDPLSQASKGELLAYKEMATLVDAEQKQAINTADEIRKMQGVLFGHKPEEPK